MYRAQATRRATCVRVDLCIILKPLEVREFARSEYRRRALRHDVARLRSERLAGQVGWNWRAWRYNERSPLALSSDVLEVLPSKGVYGARRRQGA